MPPSPQAPTERPPPPVAPADTAKDTWAWPLLCAVLGLGSYWAWKAGVQPALRWQSASWQHQPWTLWTAPLVHLSGAHFLANLGALLCLGVLGRFQNAGRAAALALLCTWPATTLGLLAWPQVTAYSGMSGLLCGMLAILWAHATLRPAQKGLSYVLFTLLALKLLSEEGWAHPIAFDPEWGFNVVYAAHFAGAIAGAVFGLLWGVAGARGWFTGTRSPPRP